MARTVTKKDLALALGRRRVGRRVRLTQLEVRFHVNLGTFRKVTKVRIGTRIERQNVMPCGFRLFPSYIVNIMIRTVARILILKRANELPSGLGGGGG